VPGIDTTGLVTGNLVRIERSSIHDGRGLRTVIFLKGCPLHCPWCSTPESQNFSPEKGYDMDLCCACLRCIGVCPVKAITPADDHFSVVTDREKCIACFSCYEVCPSSAVKKYGKIMSVDEVMEEISKDEIFYFHSGGGVTISGGEPLCQAKFCSGVFKECRRIGVHTALESSLQAEYSNLEALLPFLDHLYVDIKHMNDTLHDLWLGMSNETILANIEKADQSANQFSIAVRIPIIPGFNDDSGNLESTLNFCSKLKKIIEIELLPYHRLGSNTYNLLNREYGCRNLQPPSASRMQELVQFMQSRGSAIPVRAAGSISAE